MQLLFPFVLECYQREYILDEIQHINEKHNEYVVRTHDSISIDNFVLEHYCNSNSVWYGAEKYRQTTPLRNQPDGYIVYEI